VEDSDLKSYVFTVVVEEDVFEDGRKAFHACCPAWKGHTEAEALANITEAIELYVRDLRAAGEPVPVDPEHGAFELRGPAVVVNL
jgi:predicted RNase H-like HicB family nuclease